MELSVEDKNDLPWKEGYVILSRNKLKLKLQISAEQNHRCCYCWFRTNETRIQKHTATIEHIIPKSKGGDAQYSNLVMACYNCNNRRGNSDLNKSGAFDGPYMLYDGKKTYF